MRRWPSLRYADIIPAAGMIAFFEELLVHKGSSRPDFIAASIAMMGVSVTARTDDSRLRKRVRQTIHETRSHGREHDEESDG